MLQMPDATPARALRHSGAGRPLAILYGLIPQALKELASYSVCRWECAIRASVVMGFVGAVGLDQLLYFELSLFHHAQASTVIIAMLFLSIAVDQASAALRRAMRRTGQGISFLADFSG
jgi:phosphonate transport system permease protein